MSTTTILEACLWFAAGGLFVALPTGVGLYLDHRRASRPALPVDPDALRGVSAELRRLSGVVGALAERAERDPAPAVATGQESPPLPPGMPAPWASR